MSSRRFFRALAAAAVVGALLGGILPSTDAASQIAPAITTPPFAFPLLEGPQMKVEIGYGGPSGDATSYWGNQPALANFSVWWWDTGPATQARVFLDGVGHAMTPAPIGDGDDTNGTLYVAKASIAAMGVGDHAYYFDFTGPSGSYRLPDSGTFGNLTLDRADRFLSSGLIGLGKQINLSYRATTIPTLREAINRTLFSLDQQVDTHWDAVDGYPYADHNHYIIEPVAATWSGKEAFVTATGASRVRFGDVGAFPGNSVPAIKQTLMARGALLATGLFNESDLLVYTEAMVMNITPYEHPFLRVRLNDASEVIGDGPVDGDGWIDIDLWGLQLSPPVPFGSHFGEDYDGSDDALWGGKIGWPPSAADANSAYVLAPYIGRGNITAPDGSSLPYFEWQSTVIANTTSPQMYATYWLDDAVLFDALPSTQSVGVDLSYEWTILTTTGSANAPVWTQTLTAVNQYNATLTVRDTFGDEDSLLLSFYLHGRTKTTLPIPDIAFPEDGRYAMDLRVFFGDADGFGTIQFTFAVDPVGTVAVERFPANAPTINLTVPPDWCGQARVTFSATDGTSGTVSQSFNVTVNCVNDNPQVSGLPTVIYFPEDSNYTLGPMRQYVHDADGDTITWWFDGALPITGSYDPATDLLVFTAPADWSGRPSASGNIFFTDGIAPTSSRSVQVIVNSTNDPPVSSGVLTIVMAEDAGNASFLLSTYFTDPDGDPLTAVVSPYPGIEAGYDVFLRQVWYHPTANFFGDTAFVLVVSDSTFASLNVTVNIQVLAVNDPPQIDSFVPPGYVSSTEGTTIEFRVNATDPDDSTLIYTWVLDGVTPSQTFTGSFNWTPDYQAAGRHTLKVIVSDNAGATAEHTWQMQISQSNRPPVVAIIRPPAATFKAGQSILLQADATDPDGDPLTYTWSFGGLFQPKTGENITLQILAAGNYTVRLTVSDGSLSGTATTEIDIVYDKPPDQNCTTCNGTPPPPPPVVPGLEAAGALLALGGVAVVFVVVTKRRR